LPALRALLAERASVVKIVAGDDALGDDELGEEKPGEFATETDPINPQDPTESASNGGSVD
jgi:hypothetical protein